MSNEWRCGYCLRTAAHCRRRGASPVCDGCRATLAAKGKKFCRQCGQARPLNQFSRVGLGEARRATCQTCRREYTRASHTAYMRRWRDEQRAHFRAYAKAWRARNSERVKQHSRNAYINRKVRESERLRAERSRGDDPCPA